jgi:hypothetical protein
MLDGAESRHVEEFSLDREYANRIRKEQVVEELRRVAAKLGNRRFSRREFDEHAESCKGSTVLKNFDTWNQALDATGLDLATHRTPRTQISDSQLLEELGRIWRSLGHRPSKGEWDSVETKYSYTTYKQRFGGWLNACVAFLEGTTGTATAGGSETAVADEALPRANKRSGSQAASNPRYVPLKVRLQVMTRDRFCCVMCGRSPAAEAGVQLHIDHVIPFSRGGASIIDNLQTLCQDCSLGKGNDESLARPV